jgi:hypothetical protein
MVATILLIFIEYLNLLANQANFHVFLYIVFQIRPIIGLLEECYGELYTTMAHKGPIMTFLLEHILKPFFWNIELIWLIPQKSIPQMEM